MQCDLVHPQLKVDNRLSPKQPYCHHPVKVLSIITTLPLLTRNSRLREQIHCQPANEKGVEIFNIQYLPAAFPFGPKVFRSLEIQSSLAVKPS